MRWTNAMKGLAGFYSSTVKSTVHAPNGVTISGKFMELSSHSSYVYCYKRSFHLILVTLFNFYNRKVGLGKLVPTGNLSCQKVIPSDNSRNCDLFNYPWFTLDYEHSINFDLQTSIRFSTTENKIGMSVNKAASRSIPTVWVTRGNLDAVPILQDGGGGLRY